MLILRQTILVVAISLALIIIPNFAKNGTVKNYKILTVVNDLPKKTDMILYVKALDKILNYMEKNKIFIDINFYFGLFLVNVNLKNIIKFKQRLISVRFWNKLNGTVKKTDSLLDYFEAMVARDNDPSNMKNKLIYSLFSNQSTWVEQIRKFNVWKQMQMPTVQHLKDRYTKWDSYMKTIDRIRDWVPKSNDSDKCMVSLAENPVNDVNRMTKCQLDESCYDILINGSDFGYTLSHRLLLLLIARYGRGCFFFTPFLDRELTRRFCTASYGEAEFISKQKYVLPDLLLEKISLCGLDGHTQFVHRSWIRGILQFQSPEGCFGISSHKTKRDLQDIQHHTGRLEKKNRGRKKHAGRKGKTDRKVTTDLKKKSTRKTKSRRTDNSTTEKSSGFLENTEQRDSFFGITEDETITFTTTTKPPPPQWNLTRSRDFKIGSNCTSHLTAVAASAFATSLKFLLMSYF